MTLEDIDEKFDKVAKNLSKKDKDPHIQPDSTETTETETYEKGFEKNKRSGLLSVFENHLRQQLKKEKDKNHEESDSEFRTVELNMTEAVPTQEGSVEKVTPEEIDSLIKFTKKPPFPKSTETTTVDNTVYSQRRYDDTIETVNNVASIEDTKITKEASSDTPRYTDTHPTVENSASSNDGQVGLPPVNKTTKGTTPSSEVMTTGDTQPNTQENVSPDVLRHIKAHRKTKQQSNDLPDNYIKEDKN